MFLELLEPLGIHLLNDLLWLVFWFFSELEQHPLDLFALRVARFYEFNDAICFPFRQTLKKSENARMTRCKSLIFLDPELAKRNFSVFP